MRVIRYRTKDQPASYGWVHENKVGPIDGEIFGDFRRQEATLPLEEVTLLPPVLPGKILCIGRNYVEHAKEHNVEVPKVPLIFMKPPSSILAPGGTIVLPPQSNQVEHEGELVVVLGKSGRHITPEQALGHVYGYTVGNDVTARDLQRSDGQWTRAKGFDTFCPVGPRVVPLAALGPLDEVTILGRVNGAERQRGQIAELHFPIGELLAYISRIMTLEPGDLVATGTPAGVGPLRAGDVVEVEIPGVGVLRNPVAAAE